ncbi:MAG: GerW family sporulation protein [Clostridia bacterium]|nr:GerW family sporulation protein [Clostridia bacterium]
MNEHPIEGLMNTVMSNLRDMVDVNTVIGETIELENGNVIVPVSKVSFGFAAGGSEFNMGTLEQSKKQGLDEETKYSLPFGGGSGAGVNIQPVGFLVITENSAKMLPVNHCSAIDKLLDYVPDLLEKIGDMCKGNKTYTYEFYEDADGCKCEEKAEENTNPISEESNNTEE